MRKPNLKKMDTVGCLQVDFYGPPGTAAPEHEKENARQIASIKRQIEALLAAELAKDWVADLWQR